MEKAKFDRVCKDLLCDLAGNLGFKAIPQFPTAPQKEIESLLGLVGKRRSRQDSIDVAWKSALPPYGTTGLANSLFRDITVAWEVDASNSSKVVKSSIQNLDRLNPRLGIELLLIGGSLKAIKSFESRYSTALNEAGKKVTRIWVLHDIHFAIIFHSVTGRHPMSLYEVYINKCKKEPKIVEPLKRQLKKLVRDSKLQDSIKKEIYEKFINKLDG